MIKIIQYNSKSPGPILLVLGAIHGDEKHATKGINKLISDMDNGSIKFNKGKLILIPICNPQAYKQDIRYCDQNLNRLFDMKSYPNSYEAKLAKIIASYIDQADYVLDLHGFSAQGEAFVFQDKTSPEFDDFVKAMGLEYVVQGRQDIYESSGMMDSIAYCVDKGKVGTVLECGNKNNDYGQVVAYKSIVNSLKYLEMIEGEVEKSPITRFFILTNIIYKSKNGEFAKDWINFQNIQKGELIATYDNNKKIIAQEDCAIFLPKKSAPLGDEWFYLGVFDNNI